MCHLPEKLCLVIDSRLQYDVLELMYLGVVLEAGQADLGMRVPLVLPEAHSALEHVLGLG